MIACTSCAYTVSSISLRTVLVAMGAAVLWTTSWAGDSKTAGPGDLGAAVAPKIDTSPGEAYSDHARRFQGIPTIERASNGRLWAAWYGGGDGEAEFNYVMVATSMDEGKTWSDLKFVLDPDGPGPIRAFDPVLWHSPDGKLWLFWAQQTGLPQDQDIAPELMAISTDNSGEENPSWSEPRWIASGILMNKPTALKDGRWLLPTAIWQRSNSNRIFETRDKGNTFSLLGVANIPKVGDRNCDEPMIVERKDGTLWMLVRTGYGIGESLSSDGGKTWTNVTPTEIPHAVSRFFIGRLVSGRILMVKHDVTERTNRARLAAYLSDDDGKSWTSPLLLDPRGGISYPDVVEGPDGILSMIYDRGRSSEKEILMVSFAEQDILEPTGAQPEESRTVVNKASGSK